MAIVGSEDPDWVCKVRRNSTIPLLLLDDCSNGWASPPGDYFQVRGPNYLTNKLKIPGGECLLKPLTIDWIKSPAKVYDVLNNPNSPVRAALANACEQEHNRKPFVWAFNLQIPSKDHYSFIAYFYTYDDAIPEGSLMDRFLKEDDDFRNSRLKLIANVVKGPWIVKTAVGEQAICLLGKALTCKYSQSNNFIEIDVDIGASMVANAIVHLAFGYVTTLTVDLAFLIEGQAEGELPERILGAVRLSDLDPANAMSLELPDGLSESGDVNLSSGWWISFSNLLHVGHHTQTPCTDDHTDVKDDHDSS